MKSKKKTELITARATPDAYERIKKAAGEQGLSISGYVVECATREHGLLLAEKRALYQRLLVIKDLAKGTTSAPTIEEECDAIWSLLK